MYKACIALVVLLMGTTPLQAQSASDLISRVLGLPGERQPAVRTYTSELDQRETMRLQHALSSLGYLRGGIDGAAGPRTFNALANWARDRGWKPPTTLRTAHLDALEAELASRAGGTSDSPQSTGSAARPDLTRETVAEDRSLMTRIQSGLAELGYLKTTQSGVLDPPTLQALSDWARDRGWAAPKTLREAHAASMEKEVSERHAAVATDPTEQAGAAAYGQTKEIERLADETSSTPPFDVAWLEQRDFDLPGGDIRDGLSDPKLKGISQADCAGQCLSNKDCKAYTFNLNGNVCFLKDGNGKLFPFPGAISALVSGERLKILPPPTRGPDPEVASDISWQATSSVKGYQQRIRERAQSLGKSCEAEEASLDKLSDGLTWEIGRLTAVSGETVSLTWKGNTLEERIPVWIIVSSPEPLRFAGRGHIALGPEATNPFDIKAGAGKTRSLVSLASRGAGQEGRIDIIPLEAGRADLTIELVAYLRACQREITLKSEVRRLEIKPAPAEIVLNTVEGRASLTHEIKVNALSRTVLFNQHRFLLLDTETGSEIIERAGSRLQVSPTHRFIAVEQGGRIEIVDMVDGRMATYLDLGDLYWGLGDSFVFSTTAPWATVSIASTFSSGFQVLGQMTGPSCCGADPQSTRIGIDIENATFSILGTLGYRIGALQNQYYALISDAQGGYSSQGGSDLRTNLQLLQSIGMLSPVSLENGFDAPGGFRSTASGEDWIAGSETDFANKPFEETLTIFNRVGIEVSQVQDRYRGVLADGGNSRPVNAILEEQLLRLGINLLPMQEGVRLVAPKRDQPQSSTAYETAARLEASAKAMKALQADAKAAGWKTSFSQPEDHGEGLPDCEHIVVNGEVVSGKAILPRDVVEVWKVGDGKTSAWIARADCVAGATFGSLRAYAGFYAIDFSQPMPESGRAFISETGFLFENAIHHSWYENEFQIKANADFILSVFKAKGAIALIDRKSRQLAWIGEGLPNGDLLLNAWLTDDGRHVVQLNTDGGIYVHSLAEGATALLAGRIVDDEIAVWTPDFHYDATAEAASLIDLKFPGFPRQYSLDRFGPARRVAGLAQAVLQGSWASDDKATIVTLPPNLAGKIALSDEIEGKPPEKVSASLVFDKGEVDRITVFQDGQVSQSFSGETLTGTIEFPRLKDARWISLVAISKDGLSSLPVSRDLGPVKDEAAVTRLLAIGINTYSDPTLPSLNYALRDAGEMIATLTASDFSYPFELVAGPKDRAATPTAIIEAAKTLTEGLGPGDHAVLFLAGHGLRDDDGRFYLATSATDPTRLSETALAFSDLEAVLKATSASVTLLLDACHSGAAGLSSRVSNDDLARGFSDAGSNVTVVAAAKGRQQSIGRRETGGLFTHALATVIGRERQKYDTDGNGRIEASELYRGVKAKVVEATGGAQTPWITKSRVVGDYAIF